MNTISAFSPVRLSTAHSGIKLQSARFGSDGPQEKPTKYGKPEKPWVAYAVLAMIVGTTVAIFGGHALKDRFFPGKDNCPPPATQKLTQDNNENPVEHAK